MISFRFRRLIAAALVALAFAPAAAVAQAGLQQPNDDRTKGPLDTLPGVIGKFYANDLYLQQQFTNRFNALGPAAFLALGTTPGTLADGGTLASEISRAQAMEALLAPRTRQIVVGGLAVGGGDLTVDRTISVPKASAADVAAGTDDAKALTALSVATAFASRQPLSSNLTALSTGTITGVGTGPNTLAAGNDSRIVNALQPSGNLAGLASASVARSNLGLGSIATQAASSVAVTGGAVDGTAIGGTTPAAGKFTTILGDGSGVNVAFPSLATRTLLDRLLERPSVIDYGVDMTGTADSTSAFTAAVNATRPVTAPCGTIRLTNTVAVTTAAARFTGAGDCTFIKYDAPAGTPAKPWLDIQPSAVGADFSRFSFDHQGSKYAVSQTYDGLTGGVAVIVQADSARVHDVTGRNGYDNCFSVVRFDSNNAAVRGKPQYYELSNIRTFSCGQGAAHTGAGVDVQSGSNGTVNGLVDNGSYAAFILDTGAGANGSFSNLVGLNTAYDGSRPSYTFYIGDANSTFSNLQSVGAGYRGAWLDGYAYRTTISNLNIKAPAFEGLLIKGGTSALSNVIINSPGYGKTAGTVDAVIIDNTAAAIGGLNINGLSVQSEFNTARYGINVAGTNPATGALIAAGANAVAGAALNADLSGAVTATNGLPGTFGVVNGAALGGYWTDYTPAVTTGSGAFTTVSASGSYRVVGKTVSVRITIQIADKGTATDVRVSLPFPARGTIPLTGVESNATAKGVAGAVANGASIATLKFVDGSNAVPASGTTYLITVGGEYQTP